MTDRPLHIDWATHEAAEYACKNWHYSKSLPVPPLLKIGIWESATFVGCIIFSRGASPSLLKPYGLEQQQGCELTRIAMTKHSCTVSKAMKYALAFLKKKCPELRLVVSFADPQYGHHGGVYQAGNWVYVGTTAPSVEYWHNGKRLHSRQVSEKGWNIQQGQRRKTVKPSQCNVVKTPGKHRYLMPLDKAMRAQIQPLAKPYPKRAASIDSDACSFQLQEGGATPTAALNL